MPRVSISFSDELYEYIEELDETGEADSKAEAVREAVRQHRDNTTAGDDMVQEVVQEHQQKIRELEQENERLHRERRQLLEQREEHSELVATVQREQTLKEQREKRRQANMFRRAWWYIVGNPPNEESHK